MPSSFDLTNAATIPSCVRPRSIGSRCRFLGWGTDASSSPSRKLQHPDNCHITLWPLTTVTSLIIFRPRKSAVNLPVAYRGRRRELFDERDFADFADLGFNFLRLALNYHDWTDPDYPKNPKETVLRQIDRAVEHGKQHGIHLLLDFHIAPGFGQITPAERTNLWTEAEPAELCAYQWSVFAERYKGVPNNRLSFNLFNEPDDKVKPENFRRVTEQLVRAIRAKDPDRLIIVDGRNWARTPITELLGLN